MVTVRKGLPLVVLGLGLAMNSLATPGPETRNEVRDLQEPNPEFEAEDVFLGLDELHNETSIEDHDHMDEEEHNDEDHMDDHGDAHVDDHDDHGHDHDSHDDHDDHSASSSQSLSTSGSDKPWGEVIVAALIINLITLVGVIFLSGEFVAKHILQRDISRSQYYYVFTHNIIPSFACGALMATTFFLIMPESLYLISAHFSGEDGDDHSGHNHRLLEEDDHGDEGDEGAIVWRFGTCIIAGFLLPVFTASMFPQHHSLEEELDQEKDSSSAAASFEEEVERLKDDEEASGPEKVHEANLDKQGTSLADDQEGDVVVRRDDETLPIAVDWPLASSIMAGDFFHNFADGIFVGTSFMLCDRSLAITIAAATIYHEIAQEIADYFMLTKFCHLSPFKALLFNFLNGLSVLFGAILIVAIEDMTSVAIGSILGVSSGVYIYISVAECFPRAKEAHKSMKDKLISLLAFVIGAVPIGLVLLNHQHCDAGDTH